MERADVVEPRLTRGMHGLPEFSVKAAQTDSRSNPQRPLSILYCLEGCVVTQTVFGRVRDESTPVEDTDPLPTSIVTAGTEPEPSVKILIDRPDEVARKPVFRREAAPGPSVEAADTRRDRAEPPGPFTVLKQRPHILISQAILGAIGGEGFPVVSADAVRRSEPEAAVPAALDVPDDVAGKTIFLRKGDEAVSGVARDVGGTSPKPDMPLPIFEDGPDLVGGQAVGDSEGRPLIFGYCSNKLL